MGSGKLVAWDSGVFLAWLCDKPGKWSDQIMADLRACILKIESGQLDMVTSTVSLVEIMECKITEEKDRELDGFLLRSNVTVAPVSEAIAREARRVRSYYKGTPEAKTMTTPDAIHLATALEYQAAEFHTLDGVNPPKKQRDVVALLSLGRVVADRDLYVRLPGLESGVLPFPVALPVAAAPSTPSS